VDVDKAVRFCSRRETDGAGVRLPAIDHNELPWL
jgi:hypothetical protein